MQSKRVLSKSDCTKNLIKSIGSFYIKMGGQILGFLSSNSVQNPINLSHWNFCWLTFPQFKNASIKNFEIPFYVNCQGIFKSVASPNHNTQWYPIKISKMKHTTVFLHIIVQKTVLSAQTNTLLWKSN